MRARAHPFWMRKRQRAPLVEAAAAARRRTPIGWAPGIVGGLANGRVAAAMGAGGDMSGGGGVSVSSGGVCGVCSVCSVLAAMIAEGSPCRRSGGCEGDLDNVIALSILKIRRLQVTGACDERQRLLILETLQQAISQKILQPPPSEGGSWDDMLIGEEDGAAPVQSAEGEEARGASQLLVAFATVLHGAISRLGLHRIVRIGLDPPRQIGDMPRLKLPICGRRIRDADDAS